MPEFSTASQALKCNAQCSVVCVLSLYKQTQKKSCTESSLHRSAKQKPTVLKHCHKTIFCASHAAEMETSLGWPWMQEDPQFVLEQHNMTINISQCYFFTHDWFCLHWLRGFFIISSLPGRKIAYSESELSCVNDLRGLPVMEWFSIRHPGTAFMDMQQQSLR